jgi:hypothetical protein
MAYRGPRRTSVVGKSVLSAVNILFTNVDILFFTVATLFAIPTGAVRTPQLIRCKRMKKTQL